MAKQVVENLIDDIDGTPATGTVQFGLDGQQWSIDLNEKHSVALRSALDPFIEGARRVRPADRSPGRASSRPSGDKERNTAIRQWALSEGIELPSRGRIANGVQDAYDAQDVDMLYAAAGIEREEPQPKRTRRKPEAQFSG